MATELEKLEVAAIAEHAKLMNACVLYKSSCDRLKTAEQDFKFAKRQRNKAYSNLRQARLAAQRAEQRWKSLPTRCRSYAKKNFGKTFEKVVNNAR